MTELEKKYIKKLEEVKKECEGDGDGDGEALHSIADNILLETLDELGCSALVGKFKKMAGDFFYC